jgi:hypothetical protein
MIDANEYSCSYAYFAENSYIWRKIGRDSGLGQMAAQAYIAAEPA